MGSSIPHILLVDDDLNLAAITGEYLEAKSFKVTIANEADSGLRLFRNEDFDLCLLDVKMPLKDGFSLAKDLREIKINIPIIFLTGQTEKEDRIRGLELGADDYITKPFSMQELYLRITNLLKRAGFGTDMAPQVFQIGTYTFNEANRTLVWNTEIEKLSEMEAQLILLFLHRPKNRITRDEALREIWHDEDHLKTRSLSVYINKLRKRLAGDPNVEIINVYGSGYQLVM